MLCSVRTVNRFHVATQRRFFSSYRVPTKDLFVSSQWLKVVLKKNDNPNLKLLDCSWYMPNSHGPVIDDWKNYRLNGSSYFDIDEISDHSLSPLPHMVPSPEQFAKQVSELGISNGDHVVCYDVAGQYMASARAWWLFRLFGHETVSVLEKGLIPDDFKDSPDLIETSPPTSPPKKGNFTSKPHYKIIKKLDDIVKNIHSKEFQLIDARSAARFNAEAPEPRPALQRGHTPGAFNVPSNLIIQDRQILPKEKLATVFTSAGVDLKKPIATSCGSGVTAAVLTMALYKLGIDSAVYDGAWSEYAQEIPGLPVEPKK